VLLPVPESVHERLPHLHQAFSGGIHNHSPWNSCHAWHRRINIQYTAGAYTTADNIATHLFPTQSNTWMGRIINEADTAMMATAIPIDTRMKA
jgi:hypothetical protein